MLTGNLVAKPASAPKFTTEEIDLMLSLKFLWLEITNRCNLRCAHCYAGSGPYEPQTFGLELGGWINILEQARDLGCKQVQFIGGEPTLYPHLITLMRRAHELGFGFIELFTNGIQVKPELFNLMRELGVHLATSFYCYDPEVHDRITKVRGSHAKTANTIRSAITLGLPVRVGIIEMKENRGTVPRTTEFLKDLGVAENAIGMDRLRGIGRGHDEIAAPKLLEELCGMCWRGTLAINSIGEIAPCIMSHFSPVGHVNDGLVAVLQSERLRLARQQIREMQSVRDIENLEASSFECRPDKPVWSKN